MEDNSKEYELADNSQPLNGFEQSKSTVPGVNTQAKIGVPEFQ